MCSRLSDIVPDTAGGTGVIGGLVVKALGLLIVRF